MEGIEDGRYCIVLVRITVIKVMVVIIRIVAVVITIVITVVMKILVGGQRKGLHCFGGLLT